MKTNCPKCGHYYDLSDKYAGKKAKCKCGYIFRLTTNQSQPTINDVVENQSLPAIQDVIDNESSPENMMTLSPMLSKSEPGDMNEAILPQKNSETITMQSPVMPSSKIYYTKWVVAVLAFGVSILIYSWLFDNQLYNDLTLRNSELREKLKLCETCEIVEVDVYYDNMLSKDDIVFDLKDNSTYNARRIDPVHLFLQFSSKINLYSVNRVILARKGQYIFYIYASDLRQLSESYDGGGRIWSFNHLPENCRTMSGSRAYNEWSGGWFGVLEKQTKDLNDFIKTWTGY